MLKKYIILILRPIFFQLGKLISYFFRINSNYSKLLLYCNIFFVASNFWIRESESLN